MVLNVDEKVWMTPSFYIGRILNDGSRVFGDGRGFCLLDGFVTTTSKLGYVPLN